MSEDHGFVTVFVVGLMALLLCVMSAVALLGGVAVARHRVAGAADLAALAAAGHALEGEPVACAAAHRIATAHGALLTRCALLDSDALVEVTVSPGSLIGRWGQARGIARAGPVP